MSKVFELFGYRSDDFSPEAVDVRRHHLCPFRGDQCDGGGNRYLSGLKLKHANPDDAALIEFFYGDTTVQAGICSLEIASNSVWIVCPRRVYSGGKVLPKHEKDVLRTLQLSADSLYGVWSEVKLKTSRDGTDARRQVFDYTFDYVFIPLVNMPLTYFENKMGWSQEQTIRKLTSQGYAIDESRRIALKVPVGSPKILEVMTSSTSGGNQVKGTTIPQVFRKAVFNQPHDGPGINYRQVWARMVSQLIVKSQVGTALGGETVWLLQDVLLNYIRETTGLNVEGSQETEILEEVNILTLKYTDSTGNDLVRDVVLSGPIRTAEPTGDEHEFLSIIEAPFIPTLNELIYETKIFKESPRLYLQVYGDGESQDFQAY